MGLRSAAGRPVGPLAAVVALVLVGVGCTSAEPEEPPPTAVTREPPQAVDVVGSADASQVTVGVSRRLFTSARVVVLAPAGAEAEQVQAERAAAALRVPALVEGPEVTGELERLGAEVVLGVGAVADAPGLRRVEPAESAVDAAVTDLRRSHGPAPEPDADVLVLTRSPDADRLAVATATAAGATVQPLPDADPRDDADAAALLRDRPEAAVIGLGPAFTDRLAYTVAVVRRDLTQPGGGYRVFPGRRVVALYGHPSSGALGLLGEQGAAASVRRAEQVAGQYAALTDEPVVPAFEIIATVASGSPGDDGNYSNETPLDHLWPLVRAAEDAGFYAVIDLQPGRTDFLAQAKRYEPLLRRPHVGLALDPEWRLARDQEHLRQIGSVGAKEVNEVAAWLADLTRREGLPQKMFVLHQFSTAMIGDRGAVRTDHPELATVIHVDGQGSPGAKHGTWETLRRDAPPGVAWGWKNFHDEDQPMLSPRQTWAVRPTPDLVTYQ